nr:retrotransposon protein, putative, unclassified [Tanacetum cinerariifolium]
METTITASPTPTLRIHKDHPKSHIIGPVDTPIQTRNKSKEVGEQSLKATIHQKIDPALFQFCLFSCFLSQVEPKKIYDALQDPIWMDVKSAFLYGTIDEEVYVMQPPGFQDPEFLAKLYKVKKAMYGLHQAPRAWYVLQKEDGIFLSQDKYVGDILKKLGYSDVRSSNTPMDKEDPWGKDRTRKDGSTFELTAFSDDDHAGCIDTHKSICGGIQFLGDKLVSWMSKKQNFTAMSSTEAEYVALSASYAQARWMRTQLQDYGFNYNKIPLYCDSQSAVAISCNPVHHSRTKHIHTQYHFIKEQVENVIMASLAFCDYHNMVAILEKNDHNIDFYLIVDFVEASPLRITQSLVLPPVANEPASPIGGDSQGEACPTDSGFKADQDRANIAKTSTLPSDSAPRVTSLAIDEGSMQQKLDELMALCTSLQRQQEEVGCKGGAERVSDDTEEMATVLTFMDAATVLASGVAEVPTRSGPIPTAGPPATGVPTGSDVVPTGGLIFIAAPVVTPYIRRKGKETMVVSETLKKKKVQEQIDDQVARELEEKMVREDQRMFEQIARDAEIARIHAEEELQIMIDVLDRNNETVAKYLQEYHQFATE